MNRLQKLLIYTLLLLFSSVFFIGILNHHALFAGVYNHAALDILSWFLLATALGIVAYVLLEVWNNRGSVDASRDDAIVTILWLLVLGAASAPGILLFEHMLPENELISFLGVILFYSLYAAALISVLNYEPFWRSFADRLTPYLEATSYNEFFPDGTDSPTQALLTGLSYGYTVAAIFIPLGVFVAFSRDVSAFLDGGWALSYNALVKLVVLQSMTLMFILMVAVMYLLYKLNPAALFREKVEEFESRPPNIIEALGPDCNHGERLETLEREVDD